jgi:hypothetical protein
MTQIQAVLVEDQCHICSAAFDHLPSISASILDHLLSISAILDHLLSISATRVSRSTDDSCSSMESSPDRIPSGSNSP